MNLKSIGEFGLIAQIADKFSHPGDPVISGIGDDCAVIRQDARQVLLVTTDLLINRVHFNQEIIPPVLLGRKSLAVNLSDIAAMGGYPDFFFLSIAIPKSMNKAYLDDFFTGLHQMAETFDVSLIGGDTTSSIDDLMINITVTGHVENERLRMRNAAHIGDVVQVSGPLGASAAGFHVIYSDLPEDAYSAFCAAHNDPFPRLSVGQALSQFPEVHAMIDISDGLLQDLGHICRASRVGATIFFEKIPITDGLEEIAKRLHFDVREWPLAGGEDYELCWTAAPEFAESAIEIARQAGAPRPATIGIITKDRKLAVQHHSKTVHLKKTGWDHFA